MFGRIMMTGRGQRGFTAIETLVAATIAGIIGVGVVTGIVQTLNTSVKNSDHTLATKQVRNAVYWVQRDAKMAQAIQLDPGASGLPLVLSWVEWDNSQHEVTYTLVDDQLVRSHSVDGGVPVTLLVTNNVSTDPALTNCEFSGGVLSFEITISVGEGTRVVSESQEFKVDPRPGL